VGRWYDYEFRLVDSSLAAQHVTTTIAVGKSPDAVMTMLKALLQVDMTIDGKIVTLYPGRGSRSSSSPRRPRVRDTQLSPPLTSKSEIGQ
jgi:hypothetical protein